MNGWENASGTYIFAIGRRECNTLPTRGKLITLSFILTKKGTKVEKAMRFLTKYLEQKENIHTFVYSFCKQAN